MSHPDRPEAAEMAALYVTGALTAHEREQFEAALAAGDARSLETLAQAEEALRALSRAPGDTRPDPGVRRELLDRIDAELAARDAAGPRPAPRQVWRNWAPAATGGLFTLKAHEGEWQETGVAGVQVRRLFLDAAANRMTALFRMAPGTAYPAHNHAGAEECLVLDGDLHVGESVLRTGDYQRAEAGSLHGVQWTEGGCLLLISGATDDDLV